MSNRGRLLTFTVSRRKVCAAVPALALLGGGIALDGSNGTARITDSDSGALDQDNLFDRAVGPMQFIPTTWRVAGVDANGDGVKNPQDMTDAGHRGV